MVRKTPLEKVHSLISSPLNSTTVCTGSTTFSAYMRVDLCEMCSLHMKSHGSAGNWAWASLLTA